jgi:DNA-binding response OmpR family regulator
MNTSNLTGITVLLIEDDPNIINVLRSTFYKFGATVIAVGTGKDGLECLRRDVFDVVICEHELPDTDGLEFFKRTRAQRSGAVTLLVTDYGETPPIPETFELGVDNIFEKPFPLPAFIATISRRLAKATATSSGQPAGIGLTAGL